MDVFVYCRVMPNNRRVPPSDRLQAQERRCRDFAHDLWATVARVYRDEGDMHPINFLPYIRLMLSDLAHSKREVLVISDHVGRLGLKANVQQNVIKRIEDAGGKFIAVHTSSFNSESYIESIIKKLNL